MDSELAQAFLVGLRGGARSRLEAWPELLAVLRDAVRSARAAWPSVDVSELNFMTYVAERIDEDVDPQSLAKLSMSELYLVCACVERDPEALRCLERRYFARLPAVVARVAPDAGEDVVAQMRERLVMPTKPGQGLASYAGRSDLWTWLRISAVRAAVRVRRRGERVTQQEQAVVDSLGLSSAFGAAPESAHERQRFTQDVSQAVESSFRQLSGEEKTLLMQHYVDGLTTLELGRLYAVHRVSISRRLVRARRRLLERARADLIERLSLTTSECSSVLRLVRSQLHITLERVLA